MKEKLELLALRDNIESAFKSMIKSGRPDILDEDNNNLLPQLYVDLIDGDYYLKQALDENHVIFKGRRGTGKSTIFLQAENHLFKNQSTLAVYINLQSCYEEIRPANTSGDNKQLNTYNVYVKFFNQILTRIEDKCKSIFKDRDIDKLFKEIQDGEYIDSEFQRSMQITTNNTNNKSLNLSTNNDQKLQGTFAITNIHSSEKQHNTQELRIFSINTILTKMKKILEKHSIKKVYLFLDDFSELDYNSQKLIIDSLIAPIISSYNDTFIVKLAAYPYRIYLGNIDSSKIIPCALDFYDVYEKTSLNYSNVEASSIDFIKRTIKKRISVYTSGQLDADELFNTQKEDIETYYKTLFYASAGIPRCLGYILTYSYLNSINKGNTITIQDINNASKTYFNENILVDFYNDNRYKQSFFDDNKILTQLTHKKLMDDLIEIAKTFKRQIISKYTKKEKIKDLYKDTIEKYKNGITFWLPSSHFYVEKDVENILQTLELYYIVSKFNEGSSRKPGLKISYYGLNYGLCLENNIDYGKPELRRAYDYWRQDEFNYTTFIPAALNAVEVSVCTICGYKYENPTEYAIAKKFGYCLSCKAEQSINSTNQLQKILAAEIAKWKEDSLPDIEIDILRVLYNNRMTTMPAVEIGSLVERHHLGVTKIMDKLKRKDYISYETHERRYYKITQKAIDKFFEN